MQNQENLRLNPRILHNLVDLLVLFMPRRFSCNGFSRYTSQALNTSSAQKPGPLAQSVEQRTFNPWVVGSIPTGPTQYINYSI